MTDWYRRSDWNEEVAADFEARLARARHDRRAQYLSLQGYALLGSHPEKAEALLDRAVAESEPSEMPRAACYLALARVAAGKIDEAIEAYDRAIEAQRLNPAFRSTAGIDQALLIGLYSKRDRYGPALDQLTMAFADGWSLAGFEALAAEALIRFDLGELQPAGAKARAALDDFPDEGAGSEWAGISIDGLRSRLEEIAR